MATPQCLDEDTILDRIARRLDGERAERVERHLAVCAACRKLVSEAVRGEYLTGGALAVTLRDGDTDRRPPHDAVLARGTPIDRYIVLALLGKGGMGVVYRAYDPDLDRQVALKLVGLGDLAPDAREQARLRLVREAQALAQLSSPHVVTVHDVGKVDDDVFIAMELVEGNTLRHWLAVEPRSPREILRVFVAAAEGLAAAHAVGVVHRDFKPDNVMVARDGRVRVVDFGLARVTAEARASRPSLPAIAAGSRELTHAGTMLGTPAYMSPEQDAGGDAGPASDQFSFCIALYEALYGRSPYRADNYGELAEARATGTIVAPPNVAGVPSRVRAALLVGLRPSPTARHVDMAALIAALEPRRSSRKLALAALAAVAVAGAGIWLAVRRPSSDPCATAGDEIAKVWNPERREAFVAATGKEPVAASIDRWTHDWAAARHDLCERSHVTRSDPWDEPKGAEQLQCLQRHATELDATLTVYTSFARSSDLQLKELKLTPLAQCTNLAAQPVSDRDKALSMPIMKEVLRARFAQNSGKLDEAVAVARSAVTAARAIDSPAVAIALSCLGDALGANGELDEARATYREAAIAAAKIHEDGMVADAWMSTIQLTFRDRKFDDKLDDALFSAQLAITRLPTDDARRPMFDYTAGTLAVQRGRLTDGIAQLEKAIAGWGQLGGHAGEIATAENSIGLAYADLGEWDKAKTELERAAEGLKSYGPDIPQIGTVLANLGMVELYQEHYPAAEDYLKRAMTIYDKLRPGHLLIGEGEFNLGSVYAESGRCDAARPHLAKGRAVLEQAHGASSPMLAMPMLEEGRCEHDPKRAVDILTRARTIALAHPVVIRELPEIDFALAQALDRAHGDRARIRELAAEARKAFIAIGAGTAPRVQRLDHWLRSLH